ncbi:IclR family transcriptional regulator [Aliiroseovarius subalbicans]|uniref:IclR family transcriptional regulator n=1 Tax=Aliiroseovarius subalbicans TaxID=2925840 RepID=UPI001F587DB6|nr:IclR family transcriptional regulator [Aliiroseovarius subalbicans]MCI2399072.1 IclR family transcriptional regulator [Aliiroseovarius subalbicans]
MKSNALLKTLHCLEAFHSSDGALTAKDIAKITGDSLSSVQRSTFTMEALGYLEREVSGNRLVPGRSCLRPAYAYLRNNRFLETATPYLIDLSERLDIRADLTVLDGTDIVYLARIPNRDELLNLSPLGRRWPAISTASGRAILSALPHDQCESIVAASRLTPITHATLTKFEEVREAIKEAESRGFAFQSEEVLIGAASIGSAVLGKGGKPLGAIIVGGAAERFSEESQRQFLGDAVVKAASAISAHGI